MKFLVVDDSSTMRRIVSNALRDLGYTDIVDAADGVEGLAQLEAARPDFLVTDWNMPNKNGLELTQAVRSHPEFSELPILMITTRGMKEDVVAAMQARVNNYVVKPFTAQVLGEKIDAILKTA
ncbi:response regulator [Rubrivirga sp. S365]|uniref:Response regulator n=1 Tax=Rubrivirga litoralis TaxID=3075598 RepID=A0ABU3BPP3_9BACT|nr:MULTISPECIES: response regulator [unclassified Rubrivirga]MDT0631252.1 response regulator [Rubrivirga sp. F394]MDT7856045.1 response regulator [Rubrivirga sp. S365]